MTTSRFYNNLRDRIDSILEPRFTLMYYLGSTLSDVCDLPVWQVRWYTERLNTEIKRANDAGAPTSKAMHHNTPDIRALQGRGRQQVPARLRRMT